MAEIEEGEVSEESRQHQEDLIKAGEDTGALVVGRTAWARTSEPGKKDHFEHQSTQREAEGSEDQLWW